MAMAEAKHGAKVSCTKGCAACCDLLVLVSWPEALFIAHGLEERGLTAKYLPLLRKQAQAGTYDGVNSLNYFIRRISCAFLQEDRTCGIYEIRPTACRYHAVISPAELCEIRDSETPTVALDTHKQEVKLVSGFIAALISTGFRNPIDMAPLPVMVLGALRHLGVNIGGGVLSPHVWDRQHMPGLVAYDRANKPAKATLK
jgi:Fe-S-cluster containining protein